MIYTYTAVFTPAENSDKFYVRVPDVPGCVTSGQNLEDAIEQITDALAGCLVVARMKPCQLTNRRCKQRCRTRIMIFFRLSRWTLLLIVPKQITVQFVKMCPCQPGWRLSG